MTSTVPNRGGPAVVALGGGHGLATTLRAARNYAGRITAVVSVADDGGSSGRLRKAFGIPAPGDLRRCFGALADDDSMLAQAFEHRFDSGELDGHPVGNLLIAGLTAASGDFVAALAETGRLVQACGEVLPATSDAVVLLADVANGDTIAGQVEVDQTQNIERIRLEPAAPLSPQPVLDAIASADQIVIGPGSLHTSLLAVLAVPAINAALQRASANTVFVANLRAIRSTAGWDLSRHLDALAAHGIHPTTVLIDENSPGADGIGSEIPRVVRRPIARFDISAHDPAQLAKALADLVG